MNKVLNIDSNLITNVLLDLLIVATVIKIIDLILDPPKNNQIIIPKLPIKRKDFSEDTKRFVLFRQGYRCNSCFKPLDNIQDFHHRNGNRGDNSSMNCEALCPNCHAKKTRKC